MVDTREFASIVLVSMKSGEAGRRPKAVRLLNCSRYLKGSTGVLKRHDDAFISGDDLV